MTTFEHTIQERPAEARALLRHGPTIAFAVVLFAFLLPFGTVSCGEPVRVTGAELATFRVPGAGADAGGEPNFAQQVEDQGSVLALVALLCAAAGLALAAFGKGWWGLASAAGLGALILLPLNAAASLADVWLDVGFVLAAIGFTTAGCLRALARARRRAAAGKRCWFYALAASPLVLVTLVVVAAWLDAQPPA